jgi:hypothetical protein
MNARVKQLSFFEQPEIDDIPQKVDDLSDERPETYKGMYAMHKYWSKKPHNLVARYIQRFSERGEIVLDAFCGSGVTVMESVRLDRRAVGIDINPIAVMSTKMGLEHVDITALKKGFDFLRREVVDEIDKLYYTECPRCGDPNAIATHTIWENSQPKEIWVACEICKTSKGIKAPSEKDRQSALLPTNVRLVSDG